MSRSACWLTKQRRIAATDFPQSIPGRQMARADQTNPELEECRDAVDAVMVVAGSRLT
jgi:hypothetical protein